MDKNIMQILSDYDSYIDQNWEGFIDYMCEMGFSERDVDEMGTRVTEFLTDEGYR